MVNFDKLHRKIDSMAAGANTSCRELVAVLEDLGFDLVECGDAGHMIAKHPAVELTEYPDFDCGHNEGTMVKRPYLKKLSKFVGTHAAAIKEYLK